MAQWLKALAAFPQDSVALNHLKAQISYLLASSTTALMWCTKHPCTWNKNNFLKKNGDTIEAYLITERYLRKELLYDW